MTKVKLITLKSACLSVKVLYWKLVLCNIFKFLYCFFDFWEMHIIEWQAASGLASLLWLKISHYSLRAFCIAKKFFSLWILVSELFIPSLPQLIPFVEIATYLKTKARRWLPVSHSSFSLNHVRECLPFVHLSSLCTNKIKCKYITKNVLFSEKLTN